MSDEPKIEPLGIVASLRPHGGIEDYLIVRCAGRLWGMVEVTEPVVDAVLEGMRPLDGGSEGE